MAKEIRLTRGLQRRLMYVENKDGKIDGADARIGWVSFSKTGGTVYYRDLELRKGGGRGNFTNVATFEQFWVSGVKKSGSNVHWAESASVAIDADAQAAYAELRGVCA